MQNTWSDIQKVLQVLTISFITLYKLSWPQICEGSVSVDTNDAKTEQNLDPYS